MRFRNSLWTIATAVLVSALAMPLGMVAQDNPSKAPKPKHHTYRLVDMGTFGGAQSYVNEQINGAPSQNSRGDLVGSAEGVIPLNQFSNSFQCFPGPNVNHAFRYHGGQVSDLGAFPPSDNHCSNAQSTNQRGDVAGVSEVDVFDPVLGNNAVHGFVFGKGSLVDLGTLGGIISSAGSINNRGQVVGFATNTTPDKYSLYYLLIGGSSSGTQTRAYVSQDGTMQDLGTLGGPDANSLFVNEAGQISGFSYTDSVPNPTTGLPTLDPFLWQNGRMQDLGSLGGTFGFPDALNNRGQVVGASNLAGDQISHPFLWDGKNLLDLGTLGGDNGEALAMNDPGDAVGRADLPDGTHDGFVWRNGVMADLGTLPGTTCSRANQINNQGQIVGNVSDCVTVLTAVLWEHGGQAVDLNMLISPNSSLYLANAIDINDRGEISGMGRPAGCQPEEEDSCWHAYLLVPNGDCDDSCEQRIADGQRIDLAPHFTARPQAPVTPAERIRNTMRQRFGLPGSRPTKRN